jgi:glycosyltransferase involved in cell wall biosynthesis
LKVSRTKLDISVVIPAHNEAPSVGYVVRGSARFCDEVIVVDDGSTDRTGQVSEAAGATVIRNPKRLGIVRSTAKGLRAASGEVILTLDADGQHDPVEIENLLKPILRGEADLVLGSRRVGLPASERFISKLVGVRVKCHDVGTGYRALSGALAREVRLWGVCLCGSFVLEAYRHRARVVEVPIHLLPRRSGKSHWARPCSRGWTHLKQVLVLLPKLINP